MNTKTLDLSALRNALYRLIEGNDRYLKDINDTQIRDGLIHILWACCWFSSCLSVTPWKP